MKRILLSIFTICTVASLNAQITGGDLTTWTAGEPDSWMYDFGGQVGVAPGTLNLLAGFGEAASTTEVTGAAAAGGSGSSALISTIDVVPGGAAETQLSLTEISGFLLAEWSYTGTPLELSFDYDARPSTSTADTCLVQCVLYDAAGGVVGVAGAAFPPAAATTDWTAATIPFIYNGGTGLAVASIEITVSASLDAPIVGSQIYVDNFAVSGVNGVEEFVLNANAYPNPANDILNINLNANITSVSIIGLDGKVASTQSVNGTSTTVDVADLTAGVYFYEVVTEDGSVIRNNFVKK